MAFCTLSRTKAACRAYSRAYLRHSFKEREILSAMLASYHNLAFMHRMMTEAREASAADRFGAHKAAFLRRFLV